MDGQLLVALGALMTGIAGCCTAWAAVVRARKEGSEDCEKRVTAARAEAEELQTELHDFRMRRDDGDANLYLLGAIGFFLITALLTIAAVRMGDTVGATGPAGPPGPTGATGSSGPAGPRGSTGTPGVTGDQGSPGATGAAGALGAPGPAGSTGKNGAPGPQGASGSEGKVGPQGVPGPLCPPGFAPATEHVVRSGGAPVQAILCIHQ